MKIKKTCKGRIKMTLSHKEAVVVATALDAHTIQDKELVGTEHINRELFDREIFKQSRNEALHSSKQSIEGRGGVIT